MKILMVISGEPKQNPQGLGLTEKRFPVGVGYLISVLRNNGHKVDFLDRYLLGNIWPKKWNYDLVGIYSSTVTFPDTLRIIKKVPKQIPIAVGGPHTVFDPTTIPKRVKWICQGEGERCILDIAGGKLNGDTWKYPRIEKLDNLPTPAFDVFVKFPYLTSVPWFRGKVFNFCTSRGCPYNCSFCFVRKIWGHKVTLMSSDRIVADMLKVKQDFGAQGIYFREDNFTISKARVKRFCELLLLRGIKTLWACETRADVDLELLPLMKRAGLKAVYVGIESGSQKMLNIYNKQLTVGQIENFLGVCNKNSIQIAASIIVNHPKETNKDRKMTQDLLRKYRPSIIWTNPWRREYVIPPS